MRQLIKYSAIWVLIVLTGCLEPYIPDIKVEPGGYLVVDGTINSQGATTIRLSRTIALAKNTPVPAETNATIFIEEEGGTRYPLTEGDAGTYTSAPLVLNAAKRVRLYFRTAAQKEYASDYTAIKTTPPIDTVGWKASADGVQILVNSHDDTNQSRYYRWEYEETWQFTSAYRSLIEYKNNDIVYRPSLQYPNDIYNCWSTEKSTSIKLGTTVQLTRDFVSNYPLVLLPPTSVKLRYRYSILVKQAALTSEEYDYWEALRKNTENIGTLFDPLPTQLTGNVHSLSSDKEVVIGFVGAQSVTQQRIFIDRSELPREWRFSTGYEGCAMDTIPLPTPPLMYIPPTREQIVAFFSTGYFIPVDIYYLNGGTTPYYLYSSPDCVDCRKRGTNVRPSFWK